MAICSFHCQKKFVKSAEGLFKLIEIILGFACWGLLYFGDAMVKSNEIPEVNDESLLLTLTALPAWIITCASYLVSLLTHTTKCSLTFDAILNLVFTVAYAASTTICGLSRDFVWLCLSPESGAIIDEEYCDLPGVSVLRNGGQNMALVIISSIMAALYFTHLVFLITKLCTHQFIQLDQSENEIEIQPINL